MQTTTNIGLKTYEANDPTDWLGEFNYNMNKIDTAVGSQNDQIDVIEETAGTAVTTANTASATAEEALTTAEGKTSVNDNVASATTTYSSNKINELISEIQPGTEIDDTTTSTTKTWSSSKINTEVSAKASINDTTASNTSTYSSNKINSLTGSSLKFPDYANMSSYSTTVTIGSNRSLVYTPTDDCLIGGFVLETNFANNPRLSVRISGNELYSETVQKFTAISPIFVKANTQISFTVHDSSTADVTLHIFPLL